MLVADFPLKISLEEFWLDFWSEIFPRIALALTLSRPYIAEKISEIIWLNVNDFYCENYSNLLNQNRKIMILVL